MSPERSDHEIAWEDPEAGDGSYTLPEGDTVIGRAEDVDVVLNSPLVSRTHARFERAGLRLTLRDLGSSNGTFVNGERITEHVLRPGDNVRVGSVALTVTHPVLEQEATVLAPAFTIAEGVLTDDGAGAPASMLTAVLPFADSPVEEAMPERGVVPDEMLRDPVLSEEALAAAGVEVIETEYMALGGGVGSFVFTDLLRTSGVAASDITVIGNERVPYARYQRLCINSQIPASERLRSNSDSCPDNVWGFPGYATREAWRAVRSGNLGEAASLLWSIFGEPAVAQTYTPISGDVFDSIDREAERIGWDEMLREGRIRAIRKTDRGRVAAVVSTSTGTERRHSVVVGRFAQFALGYPAIQMLPDLATYREQTGDHFHIVNAYEDHDAVYEHLREHGGTVMIRGRGIVASRVLQKLWEDRAVNPNINVVHLHRSRLAEGHQYGRSARKVEEQFEFQPFNWPKSCWGGELRDLLESSDDTQRAELLGAWGGTTTASRDDWRELVKQGVREGWYRPEFGSVREVVASDDGRVTTRIDSTAAEGSTLEVTTDFVIDCVGLEAGPERSPVIHDLMEMYDLPLNPLGRLKVNDDFELPGLRHDSARVYTAGAVTLGGPYAAVDSFLGLQYSALRAVESILASGLQPRGLRPLRGLYSFRQWMRWAQGVAP